MSASDRRQAVVLRRLRSGEALSAASRFRRWVCSKIGHKWVWTGGWVEMDCARCGMTDDERRELLREKGLIP